MITIDDRKHAVSNLISSIDKHEILEDISKNCYKRNDSSASWVGPFIPSTTDESFVSFNKVTAKVMARWAKQHWMIYDSFIDEFCTNADILDIGCGSGNTTILLATVFTYNHVIGLDSDKKAIKFCKKYNSSHNIEYYHKSFEDFKSNKKFDYIFACEVLEHMSYEKQFNFIDLCFSHLSENGLLFLTTPNSIDDQIGGHHPGLLNREEFKNFYSKIEKNIHSFSYFDNEKLDICKKGIEAVYYESHKVFDKRDKNRSHFRLVLKKK